ncbi:MAG: hypothetical protein QMC81_02650 [Thermoanaerobacterales bacterium]|nr:hypothetical protein [Bacillota bacterium]MDI6906376.1 hypothetical protein [Thermoanaerobacterales bacterium]
MVIQDRSTRGFIAGVAGGVAMNIVANISFYINWGELRFLDWAAVIIFGSRTNVFWEAAFAQVAQILFVGLLGIVFAYLIPAVTSRNCLLKGWLFGAAVWFGLYGVILLFKVNRLVGIDLATAASDFVGASVYGLVLACTLRWMDERVKV